MNKITTENVNSTITGEDYYVFPGTTTTVCCLKLKNGFSVIGESGCVDKDHFSASLGREIARADAWRKIWRLEGYALAERLAALPH